MGNVHCGQSVVVDDEDDDHHFDVKLQSRYFERSEGLFAVLEGTGSVTSDSSNERGDYGNGRGYSGRPAFLKFHRDEPQPKCLLDLDEVRDALVEQAEQLLHRERMLSALAASGSGCSEDDSLFTTQTSADDVSMILFSMENRSTSMDGAQSLLGGPGANGVVGAETMRTTDSCITRPTDHRRAATRRAVSSALRRNRLQPPPIIRGGSDFFEQELLHDDIQSMVSKPSKYALCKRDQHPAVIQLESGRCSFLAHWMEDEWEFAFARKVGDYTSVLHLKMVSHCMSYLQKNLTGSLSGDSVVSALMESVSTTNLSPPRTTNNDDEAASPGEHLIPHQSDATIAFGPAPPSSPVRLLTTDSIFIDLAMTGSLGLVDRGRTRSRNKGVRKEIRSPRHYSVLINRRSGSPLAVCALRAGSTGSPVVRVFATKRRVGRQRPSTTTKKLGLDWCAPLPLYSWAEIVTEGEYPDQVSYSIFMAAGSDGRFKENPSFRATHETPGFSDIRIEGRTEREDELTGCAVLSLCRDEDKTLENDIYLRLSVSRGIDPALLVCFASFVDESIEKALRQHCRTISNPTYRLAYAPPVVP